MDFLYNTRDICLYCVILPALLLLLDFPNNITARFLNHLGLEYATTSPLSKTEADNIKDVTAAFTNVSSQNTLYTVSDKDKSIDYKYRGVLGQPTT